MSRRPVRTVDHVRRTPPRLTWAGMLTGVWLCLIVGIGLPAQADPTTGQATDTGYYYDPVGNPTKIISPLDPNPASPTIATDLTYDSLDRTIQIAQPKPDSASVDRPTVIQEYIPNDPATTYVDPVLKITDPRGLPTQYVYLPGSGVDNLSRTESPDSGIPAANNTYDAAGNLKNRTDARGKLTIYSYDALNRLLSSNYVTGTDTVYTYDGGPGDTNPDNDGQLTKITDESGVTTYGYDSRGRLVNKTQNLIEPAPQAQTAWTQTVGYAYGTGGNALGKLQSLTYPSGNQINYSYDNTGRINAISLNPTNANGVGPNLAVTLPIMTDIGYLPTGAFWHGNWGNHSGPVDPYDVKFDSDLDGRLTKYNLGSSTQGGLERSVLYDPAGRATDYTHTGSGTGAFAPANFDQHFSYDNLGRLTAYKIGTTAERTFGYDLNGNRSAKDTTYQRIDTQSNRLLNTNLAAPTPSDFVYDAAGNLTDDGIFEYTYSDRGRLQSVKRKSNNVITSYAYNGLEQRTQKLGASDLSINQYVYDEQGHLLGEYDFYGRPLQETVYLGDRPIAVLTQAVGGGTVAQAVTVDNSDSAKVTVTGSWPVETAIAGYQGSNYQTHAAVTGTSSDGFTWKLTLPGPGKYFFQARWTADATRATDAKYTITGANTDGTTVKTINQTGTGNTWTYLGLKTVKAATTVNITLSPSSTGSVSADAVRALPVTAVATSLNYIYTDHLNTPRVITRASDNRMVWRWDNADPFGASQPNQDPNGLGAFTYRPRFPGQLYDPETGLNYNTHRHYEPDTGTYTQSDPIGLRGGMNTYTYVNGNPVNAVDPFGLVNVLPNRFDPDGFAGGGGGLGGGSAGGGLGGLGAAGIGAGIGAAVGNAISGSGDAAQDSTSSSNGDNSENCCPDYKNIYQANDGKHGGTPRPGPRGTISSLPSNGQAALDNSVPTGGQRIGYDPITGELVIFKNHYTDEKKCIKYWHGYVVTQSDLTSGQWKSGRDAGFPNWPRKPR